MPDSNPPRAADPVVLVCLLLLVAVQLPGGIRFGDGLEFVAVSAHLGVAHPPGYPLFTILGWMALSSLPCAEPYDAVLWVCKLAVFACAAGIYFWLRLLLMRMGAAPIRCVFAAGLIAATFTFSGPMWPTQHVVEIYGLNAAFLTWIGYLLARAGEKSETGGRSLLLAGLLLGLALGNHITSGCMLPALVFFSWTWGRANGWRVPTMAISLAIAVPMLLYGSLLLRAPSGEVTGIAWGSTVDVASLIRHMSGGEYAGSRLLMQNVDTPFTLGTWITFAWGRALLVLLTLGQTLLGGEFAAWFAALPLLALFAFGLRARASNGKSAVSKGVVAAILLQLAFILTYNVPDIVDYMLGVIALTIPIVVAGAASLLSSPPLAALQRFGLRGLVSVLLLLSIATAWTNASAAYPAERGIPTRWRDRLLAQLPSGSALVTVEDADTYVMWYTQMARGERTDIAVYAGNFVRFPWFRQSMPVDDPRRAAVGFREGGISSLQEYIADLRKLVFDPLLADGGRVFTTMHHQMELAALHQIYEIRHAADLVTKEEFRVLREAAEGGPYHGPPVLLEVRAKR